MRIGHGYDAHRFCENKELVIGGVKIESELGLLAHSDGDVLVHALIDSLLGAAGEREHRVTIFPTARANTKTSTAASCLRKPPRY